MGENPIKKTIKLNRDGSDYRYLELRTDGTALDIYVDDDDKSSVEETVSKYKYTYDDEKKTITLKLVKTILDMDFEGNQDQLMTYSEICSKINEVLTVENMRQGDKRYYEEEKDDKYFKEDYPDCDTYEKYEAAFLNKYGYDSYDDYVKSCRQEYERAYKAIFGAQITYAYKIEGGKLTLTEKFTGIKNMFYSECEFNDGSSHGDISCNWAYIYIEDDGGYSGSVDTEKKTIDFESKDKEKVNATYTEDIAAGTVTINCEGKKYVCEFKGEKYIQVE